LDDQGIDGRIVLKCILKSRMEHRAGKGVWTWADDIHSAPEIFISRKLFPVLKDVMIHVGIKLSLHYNNFFFMWVCRSRAYT
jgi:hypothetical protein